MFVGTLRTASSRRFKRLLTIYDFSLWVLLEPLHRGGLNDYSQSMILAEIRKIMYTPVNPSFFFYIKVGFNPCPAEPGYTLSLQTV